MLNCNRRATTSSGSPTEAMRLQVVSSQMRGLALLLGVTTSLGTVCNISNADYENYALGGECVRGPELICDDPEADNFQEPRGAHAVPTCACAICHEIDSPRVTQAMVQ